MALWKTETPKPQPERSVIERGPVTLCIAPVVKGHKEWQHFLLSFGRYSENNHEDCRKTWPREALQLAREHLDEFEKQLEEG